MSDEVEAGIVSASIQEAAGALCESVELFDLFRGQGIPAGHRSLAFHVVYRDHAKTLTDEDVDRRHKSVVEAAHAKFGATLRA